MRRFLHRAAANGPSQNYESIDMTSIGELDLIIRFAGGTGDIGGA